MNPRTLFDELASLPADKQEEVADFIAFLRSRVGSEKNELGEKADAAPASFVGMWADRADMADGSAWVKQLRERKRIVGWPAQQ